MKVLVSTYRTAGDRIALAAVRALASARTKVFLASDEFSSPSFRSRMVAGRIVLPNPILDRNAYLDDLAAAVRSRGIDVVLPTDDYAVQALAGSAGRLGLRAPVPSAEAYATTQDKWTTHRFAKGAGVRTPETRLVKTVDELPDACRDMAYPLVLKIRSGNGSVGLAIVDDLSAAEAYFRDRRDYADGVFNFRDILAQEFVPGETHDLCAMFDNGVPVAALTSRRILTYPQKNGAGILVETTRNKDVMEQGLALLSALHWNGPAQVEFKMDARDGKPTLIEINGRLWGTLALSAVAGINFPAVACAMATGQLVRPQFDYRSGVRFRWLFPYALRLGGSGHGMRAVWQLMRPRRKCHSDIVLDDLAPFLASLSLAMRLRRRKHSELSPLSLSSSPDE